MDERQRLPLLLRVLNSRIAIAVAHDGMSADAADAQQHWIAGIKVREERVLQHTPDGGNLGRREYGGVPVAENVRKRRNRIEHERAALHVIAHIDRNARIRRQSTDGRTLGGVQTHFCRAKRHLIPQKGLATCRQVGLSDELCNEGLRIDLVPRLNEARARHDLGRLSRILVIAHQLRHRRRHAPANSTLAVPQLGRVVVVAVTPAAGGLRPLRLDERVHTQVAVEGERIKRINFRQRLFNVSAPGLRKPRPRGRRLCRLCVRRKPRRLTGRNVGIKERPKRTLPVNLRKVMAVGRKGDDRILLRVAGQKDRAAFLHLDGVEQRPVCRAVRSDFLDTRAELSLERLRAKS